MEEHRLLPSSSPALRTRASGTSNSTLLVPRTTRPQRPSSISSSVSSGTKTQPLHSHKIAIDLRRHPDLWFDDGSVICQAEDTLFKVHISQLSRHSVFFRDMFSLPQPQTGSANFAVHLDDQEIAVIYLHDKAEDVGNLLTALYDGPYVFSYDLSSLLILRTKKLRVRRSG